MIKILRYIIAIIFIIPMCFRLNHVYNNYDKFKRRKQIRRRSKPKIKLGKHL